MLCYAQHIVQLKGAFREGALEDTHLPTPVLKLSSGHEMQFEWFQVKGACSIQIPEA